MARTLLGFIVTDEQTYKNEMGDRRTAVSGTRCRLRASFWLTLLVSLTAAFGASSASAAGLSSQSLGINISHNETPADLTGGYPGSQGVGVARREVIEYSDWKTTTDSLVSTLWQAGLRLAPSLGLPCPGGASSCQSNASEAPAQAATDMASYVTAFAQRYGPGGTFWANKSHPLPVELYEIGDEPNIPMQWIQDSTHLHWGETSSTSGPESPASYAAVYEASEQALQALHLPGVEAVVGGMGDSGSLGVDLTSTEAMLGAITGPVDAVAFHPYTWQTNNNYAAMESDVTSLRLWMSATSNMANTPIEINEFDSCATTGQGCSATNVVTSSWWGTFVANYTTWALCTPGLNVQSVVPFIWGDTTETTNFLTLVDSNGNTTPYGNDFLSTAQTLTTTGCPPLPPIPGIGGGSTGGRGGGVGGGHLSSSRLRLLHIHVHGSYVTLVLRVTHGTYGVKVTAWKGHHRVRFHIVRRTHRGTLLTLVAKLARGKWTIYLSCHPPPGYAAPLRLHHLVRITS